VSETEPAVQMRPATLQDAALLFEWVNSPSSLAGKIRTAGPVPWDSHIRWLTDRVEHGVARIWIAMVGEVIVGQLRLEPRDENVEIDIFVLPEHRRRGVARQMVSWGGRQSRLLWPECAMMARVRSDNIGSRRLFAAAGFEQVASGGEVVLFRLPVL
jgi:RimJ/RimL family protein N-acetyltransferase